MYSQSSHSGISPSGRAMPSTLPPHPHLPQYPPSHHSDMPLPPTSRLEHDAMAEDMMHSPAMSPWKTMCDVAEGARLKETDMRFRHDSSTPDLNPKKRKLSERRKSSDELHNLAKRHSLTRPDYLQQPPDCMDIGICDEATGRAMYQL